MRCAKLLCISLGAGLGIRCPQLAVHQESPAGQSFPGERIERQAHRDPQCVGNQQKQAIAPVTRCRGHLPGYGILTGQDARIALEGAQAYCEGLASLLPLGGRIPVCGEGFL